MNGRPFTNGATSSSSLQSPAANLDQLPPELAHITENFRPFGKLVGRVAQETGNGFGELLDRMAQLQITPTNPMINGVNGHNMTNGAGTSSATNDEKKSLMLNWAWGEREKYVKLLVLSKWSRQAEEVSRMIDLQGWMHAQLDNYTNASLLMGQLKINTQTMKAPNPDLNTALEVLSTGKVPWMPDLGYLPPDPLTPQQMLKAVQNVNALLSIRINLHEELPRHMKDWTISSGRATFRVPSEFELDVSIADEEPASPFFIVDLRFIFTPKPEVPDDWFRYFVEPHANIVLEKSGLSGLYKWLHGFVLTHKIKTLQKQAEELSRTTWSNTLYIQEVHRSLIVQYWVDQPGAKSWIEIGIASGKPKNGKASWRGPEPPRLAIRWTRKGVLVEDFQLAVDWTDLSLERILKSVIALHTTHILDSIRSQLSPSSETAKLPMHLAISTEEPTDCSLTIRHGSSSQPTEIRIDYVSGRLSIYPSTARSTQAEYEINYLKDIAAEAALRIERQLCANLRVQIEKQAENAGWTLLRHVNIKPDATSAATGQKVITQSFYRGQGWKSKWVIAVTINLGGENWWLCELVEPHVGNAISQAAPLLGTSTLAKKQSISQSFLRALERLAVAEVSFAIAVRDLTHMRVQHTLRREKVSIASEAGSTHITSTCMPTLYIKTSGLVGDSKWAGEVLKLHHYGFESKQGRVVHLVRGEMLKGGVDFRLMSSQDDDVSFNTDGTFIVTLRTAFGESFMDKVVNRLRRIERLGTFIDVVKQQKLHCTSVSLSRLVFRYSGQYQVDISFQDGAPVRLAIEPNNPHRRIAQYLTAILNRQDSKSFVMFARVLCPTLPLLSVFDAIEKASTSTPHIHPRGFDWYRVTYENPPCTFDVRLRTHHNELLWHVNDTASNAQNRRPEFVSALKEFFRLDRGKRHGVRSGLVAKPDGIEEAIKELDEVVRQYALPTPPGGEDAVAAHAAQQQPQPTQQTQAQQNAQRQQQAQMQRQAQMQKEHGPEVIMLD
ncbi:uncharacterized protein K452DRAFT_222960 [Aplosporella prunicola CBS 121167]|uniref:Mediator of RNA polymerase II transcription subunit 14 n=1 Tax=Aplosporella prunicola CBS 121167 TaxID=1176127 RepID=A0A6A6BM51_9PEZI|nr:uncharacterized protein K452DRAFT_222960 [Aplosporella prunicola CBS 121167]KAF2144483.1 hypothetical protein K452DRAFT_222960 [Aplosporella prunicola CBS 121167]